MRAAFAFGCGLLFGVGLLLSGMTSPDRVLGFLDVAGHWDPSLAFVMGGGLLVATPLFALARRRGATGEVVLSQPPTTRIDRRLVVGAAMFGIGWGLVGLCPGPALVDLALRPAQAAWFVLPMLAGLVLSRRV